MSKSMPKVISGTREQTLETIKTSSTRNDFDKARSFWTLLEQGQKLKKDKTSLRTWLC